MQHFCSKSLCTRHFLFVHVSFTNTGFVRISYYHPSSPHLPFLNTAHLVFSSFLPPLAPLFFALSKSDSCLTEKEKKKNKPSLVFLQPCLSGRVEYTSSLFTRTCLSPECISCLPHFFSLPHALTDIQRLEKGVGAKMKSKCWIKTTRETVSQRMEEKMFPCMKRGTLDQRHRHWRKTTVNFDKVRPEWDTAVKALHNWWDNKERAARLMSNPPPFSHIYTHPSMTTPEHEICPGPWLDSGTVPSLWLWCCIQTDCEVYLQQISIGWHTFMHAYALRGRKVETCHLLWKLRRFFCEVQVCEFCHSHFKQPQPHHVSKRNRCKGGKGWKSERCGKQDGENTQGFELHARCSNVFKMIMVWVCFNANVC